MKQEQKTETATFAEGCFWGVEDLFSKVSGVVKTEVGYTGGKKEYPNPSYELVCTGKTGHAEAINITFNPMQVSYEKLLDLFWQSHNPTTKDMQGPDIGSQYRSAIFYHNEEQKKAAEKSKKEYQKRFAKPIVTEISQAGPFYRAEEYHQQYVKKTGRGACHFVPNR